MYKIEIYTGPFCAYCFRAKSLLKRKKLDYTEYDIHSDPETRSQMLKRTGGARTIPQIFINDRHVGGCDELIALEKKGALASWLQMTSEARETESRGPSDSS